MPKNYCVIEINEEYSPIDDRFIKIQGSYATKEGAIDNILNDINWKIDENGSKYIAYVNAVSNKKLTPEDIHASLNNHNLISHVDIDQDISVIYRISECNL